MVAQVIQVLPEDCVAVTSHLPNWVSLPSDTYQMKNFTKIY